MQPSNTELAPTITGFQGASKAVDPPPTHSRDPHIIDHDCAGLTQDVCKKVPECKLTRVSIREAEEIDVETLLVPRQEVHSGLDCIFIGA